MSGRGVHHYWKARGSESMQQRADLYRRFLPDWPRLWQTLEREAALAREKEKREKEKRK